MSGVPRRVAAFAVAACALAPLTAGCSSFSSSLKEAQSSLKQVGSGVHNPPGKTYTVTAPVTTVTVATAGSITVTGTAGHGPVTVTESPAYTAAPPVTAHTVSGSALTLGYTCKSQLLCDVSYDIKVPRGTGVHAKGGEGSVTITSLAGPVTAQTATGLISATGLDSPSAVLKSGTGGINATFTAPPASVQASTRAGTITIGVPDSAAYKVSADAVVGVTNVGVRRGAASPHVITAHSDLGGVTISPS